MSYTREQNHDSTLIMQLEFIKAIPRAGWGKVPGRRETECRERLGDREIVAWPDIIHRKLSSLAVKAGGSVGNPNDNNRDCCQSRKYEPIISPD